MDLYPLYPNGAPRPLSTTAVWPAKPAMVQVYGAKCDTSTHTRITLPVLGTVEVERSAAPAFEGWFAMVQANGRLSLIDKRAFGGSFNCRDVRDRPKVPSPHCWCAIDLNCTHAMAHGVEVDTIFNFGEPRETNALSLIELALYAGVFGFAWGGMFSRNDPMHFEPTKLTLDVLAGNPLPPAFAAYRAVCLAKVAPPVRILVNGVEHSELDAHLEGNKTRVAVRALCDIVAARLEWSAPWAKVTPAAVRLAPGPAPIKGATAAVLLAPTWGEVKCRPAVENSVLRGDLSVLVSALGLGLEWDGTTRTATILGVKPAV